MSTVIELMQERKTIWEKAKKFLDSHRNEKGILSAEDTATYERMEEDMVRLKNEIERQERLDAFEKEMNAFASKPITSKPGTMQEIKEKKEGRASNEYKTAFWNALKTYGGAIRPDVANVLTIGTDADGGFLVPDEFEYTIIEKLQDENIMRKLAHVITTSSGDRKIPVSASKGAAQWMDEGAAFTESDDSFAQITIGAHKVGTLIKVSDELLNDSAFNLESYIATEFARRIGATEEEEFIKGDGTKSPLGLLAETGGAEVGVQAASATAITADELIDLFYSLRAPYRKNASFILNDLTIKNIRKLKDGNGQYLWQVMGTYNDIKSKFDAINQALNDKGYKRYSGYYTFAPPSGFAIGSIMYASDINTMINDLQQNQRGLSYSTYPISTVQKGSYIKRNILVQL